MGGDEFNDDDEDQSGSENKRSGNSKSCEVFSNSRMAFGRIFF